MAGSKLTHHPNQAGITLPGHGSHALQNADRNGAMVAVVDCSRPQNFASDSSGLLILPHTARPAGRHVVITLREKRGYVT